MKTIIETPVGGDGAKAGLYVDGEMIEVSVKVPTKVVVEPVMRAVDKGVDKLEELIPGDQKELAAKLKAQLRAEVLEAIRGATVASLEADIASAKPEGVPV